MKLIKINSVVAISVSIGLLAACNKGGDDFLYKGDMLPVSLKGFNAGNTSLSVKLDTATSPFYLTYGPFNLTEAYVVPEGKTGIKLSVTEAETGKTVMEKELKKADGPAKFSFFYYNGKLSDMPEKEKSEEGKIKITYLFMPTVTNYTEPVDIVLGKYYLVPKVFEELARIKNVKPYEFGSTVTLPCFSTAATQYNGVNTAVSFVVYMYKAGTQEFYTDELGYTWHATSSTLPKPAASIGSSKMYIFSEAPVGNSMRFFKNSEQ